MPFDMKGRPASQSINDRGRKGRRIAVIGSGVAGLSAAWLLARGHDVVLYEKGRRLGGHANTVAVRCGGKTLAVDAGFIVFNKPTYPNLTALFDHLGVASEETDMSFSASLEDGRVEYSGQGFSSVFASPSSIVSPSHWAMLADIMRFNRDAAAALEAGLKEDIELRAFVAERKYSKAFVMRFLEPMAAAIWSTPSMQILDYPAASLIRFYANHGLLQVANNPKWSTVTGGSKRYVERISEEFGGETRLAAAAARVRRVASGVIVTDTTGHDDRFDDVVIAAHGDEALLVLDAPSDAERALLGAFRYQPNHAVMHFDETFMPRRKRAWASWNYLGGEGAPSVTYWMNRLQNLQAERDIFVTLNPSKPVEAGKIVAEFDYAHPVFGVEAMRAQREIWSLQGAGGVWYCGAHFGAGFHEDAVQSGLAVAEAIGGVRRPWNVADESGRIHIHETERALAAE